MAGVVGGLEGLPAKGFRQFGRRSKAAAEYRAVAEHSGGLTELLPYEAR
eukprot:CAMPEP_0182551774 /NCGR_PEP_ID=MMETSP1323-20130603/46170_1 /TAXON_ID=236787 /ORGANISM="Florenciella parvula, Strain RCC1693" /LENGTH=48 /DNA_ID= /DNA_START= /DNA_END= /DNA_ORIENTATION=